MRRQQFGGGQQEARRAVTALQAMVAGKRFLQWIEIAARRQPFDGRDFGAISLHGKHRARLHRFAVQKHGTGAAIAGVASDVRAGAWLEARWSIFGGPDKKLLKMNRSSIREPVSGADYAAVVVAQSRAVAKLSQEIAEAIQGAGKN